MRRVHGSCRLRSAAFAILARVPVSLVSFQDGYTAAVVRGGYTAPVVRDGYTPPSFEVSSVRDRGSGTRLAHVVLRRVHRSPVSLETGTRLAPVVLRRVHGPLLSFEVRTRSCRSRRVHGSCRFVPCASPPLAEPHGALVRAGRVFREGVFRSETCSGRKVC